MKILIIGDANHQFIYNFVKDLRAYSTGIRKIDILSTSRSIIKSDAKVYNNVYSPLIKSKLLNVRGLRIWLRRYLLRKEINKITETYDICNIHYADKDILPYIDKIKKISLKIVCAIWGSDVYRVSIILMKKQRKFYDLMDIIAFENRNTMKHFDKIFKLDVKKYRFFTFHLKPLESLKTIQNISKEECKKLLNINPSIITITIGYSASPGSQHLRIIEALSRRKELFDKSKNVCFLFPLTYPRNERYIDRIKISLNNTNFSYRLFTEFMTDEKVAHLRKATDIFIILTVTDQLSGSLLEHLYAKGIVLAGEWLPYSVLEEKGIYFRKISNSFENLNEVLFDTIQNLENERIKCEMNSDIIAKMNDKDVIIENWYKIFTEHMKT